MEDSASQDDRKFRNFKSSGSQSMEGTKKTFPLFSTFIEVTKIVDSPQIDNFPADFITNQNTINSNSDEITEDEKKEFELDKKQIHVNISKKISGMVARLGDAKINSQSLYRRIYRLLHASIYVDNSMKLPRVDRKVTLNDEIIAKIKLQMPPGMSEANRSRIDELSELKRRFENDGDDNYSVVFWTGFFRRWIRLRDNFDIFGEQTLANQSIASFTEFYIDTFGSQVMQINYDQCPVFADVPDKNLRPDLCIGTRTNPLLWTCVIEVSTEKMTDEYHRDDVKLFKCMRKVLDHQLTRVTLPYGGVFGLLQGGMNVHAYYMRVTIAGDEKNRSMYPIRKLTEKAMNLKRVGGIIKYYDILRKIEAQAIILTEHVRENQRNQYAIPPLRFGRGIIVNRNSRPGSPVQLRASNSALSQRDNRMESELARRLSGKLSDIKPSFHRGPNIKIAKYLIDGVLEEVILITKIAGDDREIQFLKQLDHPNIMHCFGSFTETNEEGKMSYILALERLRAVPTVNNISTVLNYAEDILKGIAHMHEKRILHRDIKPSNIMFKQGAKPMCKLIDFNLSKQLEIGEKSFTADVGTDGFQAPEVIEVDPERGYDYKSDIYSFGLTVKELSENCPKDSMYENTIQKLINTCTAQDPDKRPTAQEALEMVATFVNQTN